MTLHVYQPRPGTRVAVALRLLLDVLATAEAAGVLDERELKRWIRDAYPWGERKHWPYRAWLKARKIALARWRHEDPYPFSLPYVENPELDAWLAGRGFRPAMPLSGPERPLEPEQ